MDFDDIIQELVQRTRRLPERQFRSPLLCEKLARFSDEEVAHVLEELYRRAVSRHGVYLEILEALTDFRWMQLRFAHRLSLIFDYADHQRLLLATEWLAPLPIRQKTPKLSSHEDLQKLTLGERRSLARKATPQLLEKLMVDPDPAVIRNLLNHPRLKEQEVVHICAKHPNHPDVFWEVYASKRWFSRYQVKKAILNNPSASPRLVMLILPWLQRQDIKDLLRSRRFSPGFIRQILKIRDEEAAENTAEEENGPSAAGIPEPDENGGPALH